MRGTGVFWAIELVRDPQTREPLAPYGGTSAEMTALIEACKRRRLLPLSNFNRLHFVPPLTVTADQVREAIRILDEALEELTLA